MMDLFEKNRPVKSKNKSNDVIKLKLSLCLGLGFISWYDVLNKKKHGLNGLRVIFIIGPVKIEWIRHESIQH